MFSSAFSSAFAHGPPRRRMAGGARFRWSAAQSADRTTQARQPSTASADVGSMATWGRTGAGADAGHTVIWTLAAPADRASAAPWGGPLAVVQAQALVPWALAAPADRASAAPWVGPLAVVQAQALVPWALAVPIDGASTAPWAGPLAALQAQAFAPWALAVPIDGASTAPWDRYNLSLNPGWGIVTPGVDETVTPDANVVLPVLRTYVTVNSITLRRVDTGVELHAHSFSLSLDYQSWTWAWQASLHHDAAAHLGRDSQGDPAELEATVNGTVFRLRLESRERDRRFNPTRWAVSGRGIAAILDAPWAPEAMSFGNSAPRSAQQLMADALTVNGASMGWSIDWALLDWPVPAGAWSYRGNYIGAVNDIASAAGGYVQPHPTAAVLRVLARYPVAPWEWDSVTPDFEIPGDAAEVEGTKYVDKPAYNGVFVGGVGTGVFGPFKRSGTAGDVLAPQVLHPLITHADAHRQRGLAEISDSGQQEHVTLRMQIRPETGIIMPGQFVRYAGESTVMGIVRSTSIDWQRPVLRQTIGVETHV